MEEHFFIPSPLPGLSLFLSRLAPAGAAKTVLYVHGGTFSSALSIAYRFDGYSWRDSLCAAGFRVWGLDFHGFGPLSDPYPGTETGRAGEAGRQLETAVRHILAFENIPRLSLIAHSWGTLVAGHFAGRCPELVDRLAFFGPIPWRTPERPAEKLANRLFVTLDDQWRRFTADVPQGEAPVLSERHFAEWGEAYLDSDPDSRTRTPPAVQVPGGSFQDVYDSLAGTLIYDPTLITAPVAILRGAWDSLCTDADAAWFRRALSRSPLCRDIRIPRGTHLMHLEESRFALYRETEAFLLTE